MRYGPCMCGATDCPSCGPAQGYEVVRVWNPKINRFVTMNPEDAIEQGLMSEDDDGSQEEGFCDEY